MTALLSNWQRTALAASVAVAVCTAVLLLRSAGLLQQLELWHYDLTSAAQAADAPVPDVVLVALNDADLARWGWPVPDDRLATLINTALEAGASAVGVDIYRDTPVGPGRAALLQALQDPRAVAISKLPGPQDAGIAAPRDALTGFADIPIDPDGTARRALLLVNTEQGVALSFPMRLAMIHTGQNGLRPARDDPNILAFGDTAVPPLTSAFGPFTDIDASGYQTMVRYRHALPIVSHVPAGSLADHTLALRDKVVLIGLTSHSVKDYFLTPLNRTTGADFTFGAELHAAVTQQIIDHTAIGLPPLKPVSAAVSAALIGVAALIGSALAVFVRRGLAATALVLCVMVVLTAGLSVLQAQALLAPVVPVNLAGLGGFGLSFAIVASFARQQRRAMAGLFSAHLSEDLARDIWRQRKQVLAGRRPTSRRLFVTVLMADIEGSTSIGRALPAPDFMDWISTVLDRLGDVAQSHGGFVEKFTGDGILVVFGAPVPSVSEEMHQRDARAAVACARNMQRAVAHLNANGSEVPEYRLRIGLNSGHAVAGTLGPPGALRYNVIGDVVNVAARLEAWTKKLAPKQTGMGPICATAATAALTGDHHFKALEGRLEHDDGQSRIPVYSLHPADPEQEDVIPSSSDRLTTPRQVGSGLDPRKNDDNPFSSSLKTNGSGF